MPKGTYAPPTVVANNLFRLRTARGYSRPMLADLSGVHNTTIYNIEKQRVNASSETIQKLARALQIQPQKLLS